MNIAMIASVASTRLPGIAAGAAPEVGAAGFGGLISAASSVSADAGGKMPTPLPTPMPVVATDQAAPAPQAALPATEPAAELAAALPLEADAPVGDTPEQAAIDPAAAQVATDHPAMKPMVHLATPATTRAVPASADMAATDATPVPAVPIAAPTSEAIVVVDAGQPKPSALADGEGAGMGEPDQATSPDMASADLAIPVPADAPRPPVPAPAAHAALTVAPPAADPSATADAPTPNLLNEVAAVHDRAAPAPAGGASDGAPVREAASSAALPDGPDGLPSPLFSQALPNVAPRAAAQPYGAAAHPTPHQPVVAAQPGQIGRDMGVEIARTVAAGREEVRIRLDPAEMGRIDVRLNFDHDGSLRAVVAADSPAALEMLRREAGDLTRALADAGVRADPQSFRFDSRNPDAGASWQRGQQGSDGRGGQGGPAQGGGDAGDDQPAYRPLRTSGRVDMMA